jgi:hypothetical protein
MANEQTPEQALAARSHQHVNVFPEQLIEQVLGVIRQRADLIAAFHQLTPDQQAAAASFKTIGGAMAVRSHLPAQPAPTVYRTSDGDALLVEVPDAATSAIVYSTGGRVEIGNQTPIRDKHRHLPLPTDVRPHRIARVEFYDAQRTLIAITGSEPPAPPVQQSARA